MTTPPQTPVSDIPSLAPRLKEILSRRNISLNELSRLSTVSVATLSRLLNEQSTPSVDNVWKIAQSLQLPLSALLPDPLNSTSTTASVPVSSTNVTAAFVLENTEHTAESAAQLLTHAARGNWTHSSTDDLLDPTLPQPVAVNARQVGTQRIQLELEFPHQLLEAGSIPSLLSVVGSALTGTQARLLDIRVPDILIRTFPGPAFGMRGLRDTMNKHGRPLLSATMRPMHGLSPRAYGKAIHESLLGGLDISCDPTLLHSIPTNQWRERFRFAAEAVHAATAETNEYKTHAANITAATIDDMIERASWAKDLELAMVMVDSAAVGWSGMQSLAKWCRSNELLLCAMGGRAISGDMLSEQLQARLLRLAGADVISTGSPLRGNVSNRRYLSGVLSALRDDTITSEAESGHHLPHAMASLTPSCPAVGGGHNPWHFPRLLDAVGDHVIIQCGGSVMGHPWGSTAGAVANRTAVEALVQARAEGQNLNVEGRAILQKASRYSAELKTALSHWQEGAFLFGVINGNGKPDDATVVASPETSKVTQFRRPATDSVTDNDSE